MKIKRQEKAGNLAESSANKPPREQIEKRAYELWLAGGCTHGNDIDHWLQAEREALEGGDSKVNAQARTKISKAAPLENLNSRTSRHQPDRKE